MALYTEYSVVSMKLSETSTTRNQNQNAHFLQNEPMRFQITDWPKKSRCKLENKLNHTITKVQCVEANVMDLKLNVFKMYLPWYVGQKKRKAEDDF